MKTGPFPFLVTPPTWTTTLCGRGSFGFLISTCCTAIPISKSRMNDIRDTVTELKRVDADILVLQEVWTTTQHGSMAERLAEDLHYNVAYARANGRYSHIGFEEGSAILSRFPIIEARRIHLKPRSPWWENRIAILAKLAAPGGTLPRSIGVHLSNSSSADDQAEFLLEIMKEHAPDIIAGDLNAEPASRAVKALRERGFIEAIPQNRSEEPWIRSHFHGVALFSTCWKTKAYLGRCHETGAAGVRDAISDHDGIVVDLDLREVARTSTGTNLPAPR